MKSLKFTKVIAVAVTMLLLVTMVLPTMAFAAAGDPPVITGVSVKSVDGTTDLVSVDANTEFKLVVNVLDERAMTGATKVNASLATGCFSVPDASKIEVSAITGNSYTITFNNIKYLGGGTNFAFAVSYDGLATPLPMITLSTVLSMCKEPVAATPPPVVAPTPTPVVKAPSLAPRAVSASTTSVNPKVPFSVTANTSNTSDKETIENVTATVTTDIQLKLASGSNTVFIGNIAPGATAKATFNLAAANTAEPGSYKATITFAGTWNGENISTSQEIAIVVTQPERFEISRVEYNDTIFIGEESAMSVYYVNKGKGVINNLSAEIKGENIANPGQQQFIGNVAAGSENSLEFYLTAEKTGPMKGTIVLTYEDADGNIKTLEKEFAAAVEENQYDNGGGMFPSIDEGVTEVPMEPTTGLAWWIWLLIAVAVSAVVATVVIIVLKKRKQKKLALELEDEDEDI